MKMSTHSSRQLENVDENLMIPKLFLNLTKREIYL